MSGTGAPRREPEADPAVARRINIALLFSTFLIAACGLVYELLAGTISSYLVGDSVYQFSVVIGVFMAAMGAGAYLSRHVTRRLPDAFVAIQVAVGIVGGGSAVALFAAFAYLDAYTVWLFLVSTAAGILIGLEIPIVIRILKDYQVLALNVSNVLTVDYVGALFVALLFPLVLVPQIGLLRTGLLFGLLNLAVGGLALYVFRGEIEQKARLGAALVAAAAVLAAGAVHAERISGVFEGRLYQGEIVFAETTPYQRIVLVRDGKTLSLFVNGALQFNSLDEYRYHESLVHPAMSAAVRRGRVLVLGGGDGLALREILRYPDVKAATVVDIDPAVTDLFRRNPLLTGLNRDSLDDPRVTVVNADAAEFVESDLGLYDVVVIDLPDPHDLSLSRLYTRHFYSALARRLAAGGVIVTQATSPFYAREAFWCIERTLAAAASPLVLGETLHTIPYHAYVPTFGEWGFVIASPRPVDWSRAGVRVPTRFLTASVLDAMREFPPDMAALEVEVNTLEDHALVRYYEQGWARWYR